MKKILGEIPLTMLFLVGLLPSKGASYVCGDQRDSLPIRQAVEFTTDGQKQGLIYRNYTAADSLFRLSIEADSTYAPAYYALAQLSTMQRGAADSVLKYSAAAYQLDSLNKWYSETYAQALARSGDFVGARKLYAKGIEREPQNLSNYIMVAMLYRQVGEPEAAIAILDSAELRTGKNSYTTQIKRELLLAAGESQKAIDEAVQMTQIEPQEVEHRMVLAGLYTSTKQDSLAREQYAVVLKLEPSSPEVLNTVMQYYIERGDMLNYFATLKLLYRSEQESLDNKIATFGRLTAEKSFYAKNFFSINELATQLYLLYPTEKRVVELYAKHLIASGSLDKALELYKLHSADCPAQYDYFKNIIDIESYRQRVDSVELYTNRAIELFPDRHELHLSLSNLYAYTKRYDEAIESYKEVEKSLSSDTLRSSVWGYIGDNYHQKSLGEGLSRRKAKSLMRQAYKSYERALELNASNPLVLNNYAYFLSLEGRELERALNMAGQAVALAEGNSTYLDTYAWVLYQLGRYEEAKRTMRQVIALDTTGSAEIQFHYAEILAALGEDFMAEVYYDKALKLGYDAATIAAKKEKLK